jgi:glyoxylase-like metal-dependent hydrolase (beta-lactamase superfamily II)
VRQVVRLGYVPEDVQHIVLTHLHLDHAGGLPDFPQANVHVFAPEYEAAMRPKRFSFPERFGYVATNWAHGPRWVLHSLAGERWFGLDCVRVIESGPVEVLLVPLVAHSRGHCGVAVRTSEGWLLHCGDAYLRQMQVDPVHPRSPFPRWFQPVEQLVEEPVLRLRALAREHGDEVRLFCAHDGQMFAVLQGNTTNA